MKTEENTCPAYRDKPLEGLTIAKVLVATKMDYKSITNTELFQFARGIRALSLSKEMEFTSNQLTKMFDQWFDLNEEYLSGHYGYEDLRFDFFDKLEKVKVPLGHDFVEAAWHAVFLHPYPPEAAQFQQEEFKQLTALCWQLQKASSEDVFFLSCRHVQKLFGLNHANVGARWLRGLVRVGVLEEVEKGGPKTNKATRYRYVGLP